ncbi:MAG: cytochrome P450 [Halieaceae bacterium]|jgi:cytochrome P450|nr:cytochrome P450 [Halieaceae bacterium]
MSSQQPLAKLEDLFNPHTQAYCDNPVPQCRAVYGRGRLVFYEPWQAWIMTQLDDIMDCWREEYLSSDYYDWELAPERPPESEWGNFERALIGHSLVADHDHHRLVRKVAAPAFSRHVVDEIQRRIEPDIKRLFDQLGTPDVFDFKDEIAQHIPFISINRMIGVPEKYWEDIKPVTMRFTETWNPTIPAEQRATAVAECNNAIEVFKKVIADRRENPQDGDFLSVLIKVEAEHENFDEWDILTLLLALIGAGSDTTLMALQWTTYALLKHPDQISTALATPESFATAFSEVGRWGVISKMGFARYAPKDMEILGQSVKRGQMVLMMPHLYELDPAYFPEPETFDVTRTFDPDIRFGYGPRFCIGASLAKKQLHMTMSEMIKRFPNIELAQEPERDATDHNAIAFKNLLLRTNCHKN